MQQIKVYVFLANGKVTHVIGNGDVEYKVVNYTDEKNPIPNLPLFQVTLKGFNAITSDTDNLVKWIMAKDINTVYDFCQKNEWLLAETPHEIKFNDHIGVDYIL